MVDFCLNPLYELIRVLKILYFLLWIYILIGMVFAFILALKCYKYEKWFFRYPLMIIATSFGHLFIFYYFNSLINKGSCAE